MADAFYSSEEAAKKLNKTQKELKQMVKEGKLREFRDGPNLLFKAEEVDSLIEPADESEFVDLEDTFVSEEAPQESSEQKNTTEQEKPSFEDELDAAIEEEPMLEENLEEIPEEEPIFEEEPTLESPDISEPEPQVVESTDEEDDILMAETGISSDELSELTAADTALSSQGTSVLGQTDNDYQLTDDTMAETALTGAASSSEVPLEEIEEDVSLDSFGSGSGLLDLSLQADDTSLGGILDEIYTTEDEAPAEPGAEELAAPAEEIPDEPEQMLPAEQPAAQPEPELQTFGQPMVSALPDKQANMLGMLLLLPLIIVFYTIIVSVAVSKGARPSLLTMVEGFLWYLIGGAIVVAIAVAGVSFIMAKEAGPKVKKEKAPKKVKAPKPKKEKKVKEPKPKKEKKPKKAKK